MDEYISKQSIIDYLNGYLHSIGEVGADSLLFDRGQRRALIYSIQDISAVEAADVQPVDRWISVEDRLPEEIGYYLVVIGNEMLVSIDIAEYSENRWHKHDKVLYWQPLPDYPEAIKG